MARSKALGLNPINAQGRDAWIAMAAQLVSDAEDGHVDESKAITRARCEGSFYEFVKWAWPLIDPGHPYVDGWPMKAVCDHLQACSEGKIRRIVFNVPPGFSKSTCVSVLYPAWQWGPRRMAWQRFITISHSAQLTTGFNRRCRELILSPQYQVLWGGVYQLASDQKGKIEFANTAGGWRLASSIGGTVMGFRADVVQLDDPNKTKDVDSEARTEEALQFSSEVLPTRIADEKTSVVMLIQQRTSDRDVSGFLLSKALGYEHLCIPMRFEPDHPTPSRTALGWVDPRTEPGELAWPERFDEEATARLEAELSSWGGDFAVAGQMQQRPIPRGGGMFQEGKVEFVDSVPDAGIRVRGWDLAASADRRAARTVGVKLALGTNGRVYVEDVVLGQWGPHDVERMMKATVDRDGPSVEQSIPQDPGQAGKAQRAAFAKLLHGKRFIFSPETGSKDTRAAPFAAQWNGANVSVVRGAEWTDRYVAELCAFPNGVNSDQVDASSRAYARLLTLSSTATEVGAPMMVR